MTFQKGVKFRIYPNREQRNLIDRTLGCSRLIYNKGDNVEVVVFD